MANGAHACVVVFFLPQRREGAEGTYFRLHNRHVKCNINL